MINERNIARHELIGLRVKVERGPDSSMVGAEGTVVDETRNMLVLARSGDGRKVRVPKDGWTFRFALPGGRSAGVEGKDITFRPEDRVKRCR
jgi:ribonuclease P protein subunit POP4